MLRCLNFEVYGQPIPQTDLLVNCNRLPFCINYCQKRTTPSIDQYDIFIYSPDISADIGSG